MKAIILDGHLKSALCAVRSLGPKGVEFSVGAERSTAAALHSVYTRESFIYTSPLKDKEKFVNELEREAERLGDKPLLYVFSDATFAPLMRHRDRLSKVATFLMSSPEQMEQASDKSKTLELAKSLNIKIPTTHALDDLDEISALSKELKYPAIVKPKRSAYWKDGKGYVGEVTIQYNPGDLTGYAAKKFTESGEMPLIQRLLKGKEYGVELLVDKGDVRALCVHERIRSMSPRGGASVVKKTIGGDEVSTKIRENSIKLARALSWHGVMMVEFKVNKRTKEPTLMEINGRFWGSLPLAYFAGVDFPYMYFELAQGKQVKCKEYKIGVTSRHFLGDVRHLLRVLFSRDKMRDTLYPARFEAINVFLGTGEVRYDVIQKNDMKPFLMEIVDVIKQRLP